VSPFDPLTAKASGGWCGSPSRGRRRGRSEGRRLRGARRRPGFGPLLSRGGAGLRVVLTIPGPGGPAGGGARRDHVGRLRLALIRPS
jgi:hypothetical protein